VNLKEGFDAFVFMHLKLKYSCESSVKPDKLRGYPELHFTLTDEFINSDAELKNEIYRRGILARWFKYYANGKWNDGEERDNEKYFDSYVILEAKSKMDVLSVDNIYLRFWDDRWIKIFINRNLNIEPNKINYLGTLTVDLHKTDNYNNNETQWEYTKPVQDNAGNNYNLFLKIMYDEKDFNADLKFIKENYPDIYDNYKNDIVFYKK
jgi:hypothetical protein